MIKLKTMTSVLALAAAVAAATPVAARNHPGYKSHAQAIGVDMGAEGVSGVRAQALRECEAQAGKFADYVWGNYQSFQFRSCMAEHGQPE